MISRRQALWATAALALAPRAAARSPRKLYLDVHEVWTRELRLYQGFHTAILARGTWLSKPFRAALAEERRRMFGPTDADHADFLAGMEADGAQYQDVMLAVDSSFDEARTVGAQGDDRWNVRFEADDQAESVVEISHIRQPTPLHIQLYPQTNIWCELYLCRFQRSRDPQVARFHIGGGFGQGTMVWDDTGTG